MKITIEKHAYAIIDLDIDTLPRGLVEQLEAAGPDDDNMYDLCERLVEEQESAMYWEDYQTYENVVQVENDHGIAWKTIGV